MAAQALLNGPNWFPAASQLILCCDCPLQKQQALKTLSPLVKLDTLLYKRKMNFLILEDKPRK
jgi:hypothetical protein